MATKNTTPEEVATPEVAAETPEANVAPEVIEESVATPEATAPVEVAAPVEPTPPPRATVESVRPNIVAKEYRFSPIPKTCQWLELHGLDPNVVSLTVLNKGGFTTVQGDQRKWPFQPAEIDELIALYESELNTPTEPTGE